MEELIVGIFLLCWLCYVIAKVSDCGSNPEYESWLTEDKAKYPELYD